MRNLCIGGVMVGFTLYGDSLYEQYRFYRDAYTRLTEPLHFTAQQLRRMATQRQACGQVYDSAAGREIFIMLPDQREVRISVSRMLHGHQEEYQAVSTSEDEPKQQTLSGYEGALSMSVSIRYGTEHHAMTQTLAYPKDISSQHEYAAWVYYAGQYYSADAVRLHSNFASTQAQVALQCGLINRQQFAELTSRQIAVQ